MKLDSSKVIECSCRHDFQDSRYGKTKRVHTRINKPEKHGGMNWRCTVCKREKP